MTNLSTTTKRLAAALALALGLSLAGAPAFAAVPGPGDFTTCMELDPSDCVTSEDPPEEPEPEPEDEPEVDDSSETAPVDDPVIATPNFTG